MFFHVIMTATQHSDAESDKETKSGDQPADAAERHETAAGVSETQVEEEEADRVAANGVAANHHQSESTEKSAAPAPPPPPPPPPPEPSFSNGNKLSGEQQHSVAQQQRATQEKQSLPLPPQQQTLKVPDVRKSSTVSFKDVAELFEIDLEANRRPRKPPAVFSLRYYVMILALFSPFVVTYSRTIINFAIIDMIDPNYLNDHHSHTTTPTTTTALATSATTPATTATTDFFGPSQGTTNETNTMARATGGPTLTRADSYFDQDNSCPVDESTRARLDTDLKTDKIRAREHAGEKFEWNTVKQGLLKAAYAIGHMLLQVMGGRLSEIYGSHVIMGTSSALIGLNCLLAPFLASAHFYLLFADLFVLGILGSFMTPALITLFSNWLTPSEKSMMLSLYLVSSRLGYALSSLLCGLLIQAHLSWRYLFYSAGWISLIFSVTFFICARSRPQEHPLIKQPELDYLVSKNTLVREALARKAAQDSGKSAVRLDEISTGKEANGTSNGVKTMPSGANSKRATTAGAPWLAILTNVPVWAFIVTKFCVKLAGDTVQIELPTYLMRVMHLTPKHNGFVNASNYVIFCISCLLVGALAKSANKRRPFGWSRTTIRKVFQVIASFGAGFSLLGISLSVCKETSTLVFLMLMFFFTTFGTGGEAQIPLDISERYAGTIHAIGSSLAISGAIEPILVGYVLRDNPADRDRWAAVWMGVSGIAFLGGVVFCLFGDATIQPFDKLEGGGSGDSDKKKEKGGTAASANATDRGHVNGTFQADDGKSAPVSNAAAGGHDDDHHHQQDKSEAPPYRESRQL